MHSFDYSRAATLAEASKTVAEAEDGRFLAGGQTLIPVLKQRLAAPSHIVDLERVPGLAGITVEGGTIMIGAMTRHAAVAASPEIARLIPALSELAGGIGDPHVRNRGTIGGSLANNDPAADYPAAVLGLGATVVTDRREIAADDYFQGLFTTALETGEIITAVRFPVPERAGYVKFPTPASRYCLVGVMVSKSADAVRVAVTGAGQGGVFRLPDMEAALAANFTADALSDITVAEDDLMTDIHAGAAYRANLIAVLARRAASKATA